LEKLVTSSIPAAISCPLLLTAFIFVLMELIMMWAGCFQYIHWNTIKSFLLNIFGFTVVIWFAEWSGKAGKENS